MSIIKNELIYMRASFKNPRIPVVIFFWTANYYIAIPSTVIMFLKSSNIFNYFRNCHCYIITLHSITCLIVYRLIYRSQNKRDITTENLLNSDVHYKQKLLCFCIYFNFQVSSSSYFPWLYGTIAKWTNTQIFK